MRVRKIILRTLYILSLSGGVAWGQAEHPQPCHQGELIVPRRGTDDWVCVPMTNPNATFTTETYMRIDPKITAKLDWIEATLKVLCKRQHFLIDEKCPEEKP